MEEVGFSVSIGQDLTVNHTIIENKGKEGRRNPKVTEYDVDQWVKSEANRLITQVRYLRKLKKLGNWEAEELKNNIVQN